VVNSLSAFRLIIEIQSKVEPLSNPVLQNIASINFLHFAIFLFLISSAVLITVSLATEKPDEEKLKGIVYAKDSLNIKDKWRNINIGFSVLLVAVVALLWWSFR